MRQADKIGESAFGPFQRALADMPATEEGAVFVDRQFGAKLEFRDKNRVYMTVFNQTMEAEYEVDGDRVVIRQPTGNHVFTRKGPYIRGMDLNFKRQAAK